MTTAPDSYERLCTCKDPMTADMLKGLLEAKDIDALVTDDSATDPVVSAREIQGQNEVMVPAAQLEKAKAVLKTAHEQGKALDAWLEGHTGPIA